MQNRCYKTILILFLRVAAIIALSIPATTYAGNSIGPSSGYRDPSDSRSLNMSRGKHSNHKNNSRNSNIAAVKMKNSGEPTPGNGKSHRLFSRSSDLDKSQGQQPSSRQKRNHKQRENVDNHKKQGYISDDKRPESIGQQIINGRNKHFKTRKIPVAPISKQKSPDTHASKQKNLVTHKNQGLTKSFKLQVSHKQKAIIRPHKNTGYNVANNSLRSLKQPKTTRLHRNNPGKMDTIFQIQHKIHNSHSRHNQQSHHVHLKHYRHFARYRFSPFAFFSYSTLYYPYSYYSFDYYPFSYYSGFYPYAYPFYRSYGYSSIPYSYEEPVYLRNNPYGIDSPGWYYLAQGNFQAAINVFAKDIQSFPDAGISKVGFALASAAAGNLNDGVLSMREAFNVEPDSMHYIYFDEHVLLIIDDLVEKYEYELQQSNKRPDEAFMVSALHYLKYDYGNAHEAINRAITDGDKSPSLGKLHRLVDEQFSNEYADKHN